MRLNMTTQGGLADEFMSGGGSVVNPMIMAGDPVQPNEVATKQYVDNSMLSLNANNIISGTLSAARFPAMNGDFTSSAGSMSFVLSNTGVTPGNYTKVSVDAKGRVLNGISLVESDIPNISWNKIISDKPTTLVGYGITDSLSLSGGTLTGPMSVNGTVTLSQQLANKTYLDSVVGATSGIAVGDIITKIDPTTPTGFLKCNGADLDKTVYSTLYSVIGDTYTSLGKYGNGKPWQNQFEINTENFGELTNFSTIQSLPGVLSFSAVFVTKNRVYAMGGFNGSSSTNTGYTAPINEDGTIGAWSTTTALPTIYAYSTAVVVKNKVYLLGGYINNTTATNNIFVADINADGTIGTWGNGPAMPTAIAYSAAFINNNRLFVVGGYTSAAISTVLSVNIKEDGTLGTWVTETSLPFTYYDSPVTVIKNRVYILGGYQNNVTTASVYSAQLNSDGSIGTWTFTSSLPVTIGIHQVVVTKNKVYLIGGYQNGSFSANIYSATINSDGSIGSWYLQPWTLPAAYAYGALVTTKNHVLCIGGYNGSSHHGNVYMGNFTGGLNDYSAYYSIDEVQNFMVSGSGRPWEQQYQINLTQTNDLNTWITDSSVVPGTIRNSAVVVTNSKIYLLGGIVNGNSSSNVYVASINSDGTLGAWATDTALPNSLQASQAVVVGNRVYLIGGLQDAATAVSTVYTATIAGDGTIGAWTTSSALPSAIAYSQAIITRNRVYLIGGYNGSSYVSTVYTAPVYPNGTIGTWVAATSLPVSFGLSTSVVTKNRVYLVGGYNGSATVSTVYTTTINSDGTLGTWTTTTSLPTALRSGHVYVTKNTIYYFGGTTGTGSVSTVYKAPIGIDGTIGTWSNVTSLPGITSSGMVAVTKNVLYLIGGNAVSNLASIYSATILEGLNDYSSYYAEDTINYLITGSGRPWEQQYQINSAQSGNITGWGLAATAGISISIHQVVVTKNRVYTLGGYNGSAYVSSISTAGINSDGTLTTWTSAGSLPGIVGYAQSIVTKNRVYLLGGYGSGALNTIYSATINADGTLGTFSSFGTLPSAMYGHMAFSTGKRIYVCSGSSNSTNVYSATINSDGTLGGWIQGTAFPISTNGTRSVVTKNRVYAIGGNTGSGGINNVYTASIDPDGYIGAWVASTSLPFASEMPGIFVSQNTVYVISGWGSGSAISNTAYAAIDSNGVIGAWVAGTTSPVSAHSITVVATLNKIHLIGGSPASGVVNGNVYTATIGGGSNDYSAYYDGTFTAPQQFVTVSKFKLPDASYQNDGLNYFIKF